MNSLTAGIARVDSTPPLPIDLTGYAARWKPATGVMSALSATCLILDDCDERVVIICIDLGGLRLDRAAAMRESVAAAVGTRVESVLINVSHTHAGPRSGLGGIKIGGDQSEVSDNEKAYVEYLPSIVESVAVQASDQMVSVRVGAGLGASGLAVNRRERNDEGVAIIGWKRGGPIDRDVSVLRVDTTDGDPLAILVNYACHPTVVGPNRHDVDTDFPGPMREYIERTTGATAMFLQGAAGDLHPLEGLYDGPGPEAAFGARLGLEAVHAAADIETYETEIESLDAALSLPIKLYRRRRCREQPSQHLASITEMVELPLKKVPSLERLHANVDRYERELAAAVESNAEQDATNLLHYFLNGAKKSLQLSESGQASATVPAIIQVLRIAEYGFVGISGEVFTEIGAQIKEASPAKQTFVAGYTNGVVSYFPTDAEYAYGGYECDLAHYGYGLVDQVGPGTEEILLETALRLLRELWQRQSAE